MFPTHASPLTIAFVVHITRLILAFGCNQTIIKFPIIKMAGIQKLLNM
jgi:hypothetical protein